MDMKTLKNNILIKNILILLVSGAIAKIIGMVGKIIYTRIAGVNVVSLYAIVTPTIMLIISITQFSFPISISKLSADNKYNNNSLLKNSYLIGIIVSIIMIIIILLSANLIAGMLHNKELYKVFISTIIIIPFIMVSSVLRGFLHGKECMLPASVSNIVEEIVKIILIFTFMPIAIRYGNIVSVIALILFNIITETVSILIMHNIIKKRYLDNSKGNISKIIIKDILSISLPTTSVRLISSVGFFLEPIILTNVLLNNGYTNEYITLEYGIINSYVIPLLSIPSFFSGSIAAALLPNITKLYSNKKYKEFNHKLLKMLFLSIIVGILCLIIILINPKYILNLIYNVDYGINYIYILGPFFILLYMQPTLSVAIQSMNKTNCLLFVSLISITIKYLILIIFGNLGYGISSLIYSMITGIIITTISIFIMIILNINKRT